MVGSVTSTQEVLQRPRLGVIDHLKSSFSELLAGLAMAATSSIIRADLAVS
jgi:hypothetical protein